MATTPATPECAACKRPLTPWLAANMPRGYTSPTVDRHGAVFGKFVCYSPMCERYGLVVRIDPRPPPR